MKKEEVMEQLNAFIDEKKQKLQEIIKIFFDIKYLRIEKNEVIISFQETLAEVMYEVSSRYNVLCMEFPDCDEKEYYKNMMKGLIYQSKAIGDGYAWLFYRKNIEAIREHLKHEDNGLFPTRNGGIGEIEFIRKNKIFEGCFVIYHSITSILRNGDFSLITADGDLVGIGEIKTKQTENELLIDVYITQRIIPYDHEVERIAIDDERIWERLRKQLEQQENIFKVQSIELKLQMDLAYVYNLIEESVDKEKAVVSDDCSMIVFVVDIENENAQSKYSPETISDDIISLTPSILNDSFINNKIIQSKLTVDERLWELPLIWWDLPEHVLMNILLEKWLVFTWFNEDYLLNELRKKGFEINRKKKYISIEKTICNKKVGIDDLSMYVKMATTGLVEVKSVVDTIEKSIDCSMKKYKELNMNCTGQENFH